MTTHILESSDLMGGKLGFMVNKYQWTEVTKEHMGGINEYD
jgi:hypothetical protein